ncbi:MAG: DEAD/DEAH box helicase [Pseudomonadota bacterium]
MSFNTLGLSAELLRAVTDKGYGEPTPIQIKAIPVILEGKDILAGAQTGTGKTAGFTLPLLQRLSAQPPGADRRVIRALILTPTRELAAQVEESVRVYGKHLPLKSTVVFGGVGFNPQADTLRRGVDILVATPGRLLDHVQQKTVDLSKVEILVLDEADRMLDMGFIRDIRKILALLPKQRQNLLFSATFSDEIKQLSDGLLNAPVLIEVARRNTAAELVTQVVHPVDRERKRELLSSLISSNDWKQVLVFMRTKHGSNRLAEQLGKDGISAAAIHGNKSQGARTKALADFKKGAVRVLVATDIAARGLDIDQLPHVVNFELPNIPEDYVHRIGRTGRAGNEGEALSLVCVDERDYLRDIERVLHREIPKVVIPGFEPNPDIKAEPITRGRGGQRSGGGGRPQAARNGAERGRGDRGRGQSQGRGSERGRDQRPRPPSHAPARAGGRPQPHTHVRVSADLQPQGDSNRPEVDGNRLPAAAPSSNDRSRGAPARSHQPQTHARPSTPRSKPRPHRGQEVPALLDGNKRDDS